MNRTRFNVPKMDCAAEASMVRLAIDAVSSVHRLEVDLSTRTIDVYHEGPADRVLACLKPLKLGTAILASTPIAGDAVPEAAANGNAEAHTLRLVLAINAAMFVAESVGGYLADSSALIADSLDMFADAAVYAVALLGAGRGLVAQRHAARVSGWLQLVLACAALFEVARRTINGGEPESGLMIGVAVVALGANATCMWLLARHREGGAHMQASWIFSTNDVLANLGVIGGGLLVRATGSGVPDLAVGAAIGLVVLRGAVRILRLASDPRK